MSTEWGVPSINRKCVVAYVVSRAIRPHGPFAVEHCDSQTITKTVAVDALRTARNRSRSESNVGVTTFTQPLRFELLRPNALCQYSVYRIAH